jgi:uncharacterized peroxidase-related enzyme
MATFTVHSTRTAPSEEARGAIKMMESKYGFVPNLGAVLAESPGTLKGLFALYEQIDRGTLTPQEVQLAHVAVSAENECEYCREAHSMLARSLGADPGVVACVRDRRKADDPRAEALRVFTAAVVAKRGRVLDGEVESFLSAGFTKAQVFEVVAIVAAKTLTNYANNIAKTELNPEFRK